MAIIQLKTGTGSAVPSSLTQGEVAINIDNGLVYYGSGSTNTTKQLESFTHITASGNISSSGTITADAITATLAAGTTNNNNVVVLNSSNQLVTDAVDGAIFGGAGALLAADNANETLAGVELGDVTVGTANTATAALTQRSTTNAEFFPVLVDSANATATAEALKTPTAGFTFNPSAKKLTVDNITNVNTLHVTASGNISASGDLYVTGDIGIGTNSPSEELEIFKTGENAQMAITRGTDTQLKLKAQDNQTRITYEGGPLLFDRDESGTNSLTLGVGGHVTASGNISASGDIFANSIKLAEGNGITFADEIEGPSIDIDSAGQIRIDSAGSTINFSRNATDAYIINPGISSHKFTGHITASGNISASLPSTSSFGRVKATTVEATNFYGYQLTSHPSNATLNFNGSFFYVPLTGQSTAEHASSNANERIPMTNPFNGHPVKTTIRSTNNVATNGAKFTCSIHFEPPYNNDDFANNAPGTAAPGVATAGHILFKEIHATGDSDNHAAVHFDWLQNAYSSSAYTDIPSGSRITLSVKSDHNASVTYVINTVFAWDYSDIY